MSAIKKTAGTWDPKAWPIYFAAGETLALERGSPCMQYVLAEVNALKDERCLNRLRGLFAADKSVLIDSGVYVLSTQHAAAHNMSMDEALGLAPDKVDGFAELLERYVSIISEFGPKAWGYIEIDQGGRENKIKTRAKLEAKGLRPIPVYHPFNDGWDYFDYLAERYDRICFGNVVQAESAVRKRLIATAWERRRKYPHLWIHALGLTASELTTAFPVNSCDSSTWLSAIRWGVPHARIANQGGGQLGVEFLYDRDDDVDSERGCIKAIAMCGYDAHIMARTMGTIAAEQRDVLGADIGLFDKGGKKNERRAPSAD